MVIDTEFLIGVCNNSIKLSSQLSDFVDDAKSYSVIPEVDINNLLGTKSILKSLNFISDTSMSRLVFELCSPTFKTLITTNYFEIDIEKTVESINGSLEAFVQYMHFSTQKKYWTEVLKSTVYSYSKCIFSANMKNKTIKDLIEKLEKDRQSFLDSFTMIGSNQLDEETRILSLIKDFLSADLEMLSFSCSNIKQKAVKVFTMKIAESLIKLRSDWSSDEKKDANNTCKEILDNFDTKASAQSAHEFHDEFFKQMHEDLKKEQQLDQQVEQEENQKDKDLKEVGDNIKIFGHQDSTMSSKRKTIFLDSFLEDMDNNEREAENEQESEGSSVRSFKKQETTVALNLDELTDVIKQSYLKKKSNKSWQDRYFQLKNRKLYWYEKKESNIALNFIDLKDVVKMPFSHKPGKFTLLCDKEYKFECSNQDECEEWMDAIKNEMTKIKNSNKIVQLFQVEMKKKVISIQGKVLPNIYSYKATMKTKIIQAMNSEKFFQPKTIK